MRRYLCCLGIFMIVMASNVPEITGGDPLHRTLSIVGIFGVGMLIAAILIAHHQNDQRLRQE